MVGNGVTDEKFDGNALVPFAHGMALISDAMFQVIITKLYISISILASFKDTRSYVRHDAKI